MKRLMLAALITAFAAPSFAREVFLGTTKLSQLGDVDTLRVASCGPRNAGAVRALRFQVTKSRAEIDRIDVTFGNGRTQSLRPRSKNFVKGESSQYFDFAGGARCVSSITVWGETEVRSVKSIFRQARVNFWGLE